MPTLTKGACDESDMSKLIVLDCHKSETFDKHDCVVLDRKPIVL